MHPDGNESKGLTLLKKGQKGIMHAIFSRMGLVLILLIVQFLFLFSTFRWFENFLPHVLGGTVLFTVFMVLRLLNSKMNPTAKISWLVVIMLMPVFGALLYWYTQSDVGHRALKERLGQLIRETKETLPQSEETLQSLKEKNPGAASLAHYIGRSGCHPVCQNTSVTYFP